MALQRFDEAEASFRHGLDTQTEAGDLTGQGYGHYGLGLLNTARGRFEEAIEEFQEALRCQQESGEEFAMGLILHELGRTYSAAERPADATDIFRRVVAHRQEVGHRQASAGSGRSCAIRATSTARGKPGGRRWRSSTASRSPKPTRSVPT